MVVTWDRVGYYSCRNDLRMSFQLVLTAVPGCGGAEGDFDVEFRYNRCEWETGNASGGTNGFGGTEAQAGFDAGNSMDFVAITGSREPGIANRLCTESNVGERGVWRFQIRGGAVVCPDAGMECNTGMMGVCAEGRTSCVGSGTECQAVVAPGTESCDALDNDCDGMTDEGDSICPRESQVCERGVCIERCFEGGCLEGFVCNEEGTCVEAACEDVTCADGQRCVGGSCVGACDGVTCPRGQQCQGGRCIDICESLSCDPECQVCSDGACVGRCQLNGCEDGQVCQADGHCVDAGCDAVSCPAGQYCEGGACVDACTGVTCPMGESCSEGMCREDMPTMPDAGVSPGTDGGTTPGMDSGVVTPGEDAGSPGVDGGRRVPVAQDPGCACRTVNWQGMPGAWIALLVLGWMVRRRR